MAPTEVGPLLAELECALVGEQVGDLVPHPTVQVVAIDRLQGLDLLLVLQPLSAAREVGKVGRGRGANGRIGRWPGGARAAGHGVGVVERRRAGGRIARAGDALGPGPVRRMRQRRPPAPGRTSVRGARLSPAVGIGGAEAGEVVELGDLPDPALLDVAHLVDATGPARRTSVAADQAQHAPTPMCGLAAGIEMHHRLQDHMLIEPSVAEPDLAPAEVLDQVQPDARLSDEGAIRIVGHSLVGEQVRDVLPEAGVDIVAVGPVQLLDGAEVLAMDHRLLQASEAHGIDGLCTCGRAREQRPDHRDGRACPGHSRTKRQQGIHVSSGRARD